MFIAHLAVLGHVPQSNCSYLGTQLSHVEITRWVMLIIHHEFGNPHKIRAIYCQPPSQFFRVVYHGIMGLNLPESDPRIL